MKRNERKAKPDALALTPKQEAAIFALLESQTLEDAAQSVGISRTSLWAWMKIEPFQTRLTDARAELFREGMSALKGSMSKAAAVLTKLMDSRSENVRRLAASAILALGLKANESLEIEERLSRLERIAEENSRIKF
jgi:hypothetical protein